MIVNESFKKGILAGLSMNPLYVGKSGEQKNYGIWTELYPDVTKDANYTMTQMNFTYDILVEE